MKAGRPFSVPLAAAALRSLPARGNAGDFIFSRTTGARPIGGMTRVKQAIDAAIRADDGDPLAGWTFHDLRRTSATWLADRGVDYTIIDLCLAHSLPVSAAGKAYQRSFKIAERRVALDLWGAMLDPSPVPVRKRALLVVK
jgi:integrase